MKQKYLMGLLVATLLMACSDSDTKTAQTVGSTKAANEAKAFSPKKPDWQRISDFETHTTYGDANSKQADRAWFKFEFKSNQKAGTKDEYNQLLELKQYDCTEKKEQLLASEYRLDDKLVDSNDKGKSYKEPVTSDAAMELLNFVCQ